MKNTFLIALAVAALVGCGSKDDKGGGGGGAKTIASTADYMSVGDDLATKMIAIFKDASDCDKVAGDLKSYFDANKATIDSLKAWEKTHPDDEKKFDDKMGDKMKDMMGPMMALGQKCKDNKGFMDAMAKLQDK